MSNTRDRFKNSLLCAAIGDALGAPVENMSHRGIIQEYGLVDDYKKAHIGHPLYHLNPGQYTDDFQQMQLVAETIIEKRGFDVETFAKKFARWGELNIAEHDKPKYWWRFPGSGAISAAKKLASGISWEESGTNNPTCGASMRVAPVGLKYHYDPCEITKYAQLCSRPSHANSQAIAAAVTVAHAVALAVNGDFSLSEVGQIASWYDKEIGEKIQIAMNEDKKSDERVLLEIDNSWVAKETVPSALYCAAKHIDSPKDAILLAVNNGGDADSIACITGAIVGAANDELNVPESWLANLEDREKIEKMAIDLHDI